MQFPRTGTQLHNAQKIHYYEDGENRDRCYKEVDHIFRKRGYT